MKLIADQAGEGKFFTKDRPYGKVSGLFGRPLPSERLSAMSPRDRGSDVRFMPQMELDFEGSQKPVEAEPQGYTFWQLTGIDKNDKNIYKKVSDVLINTDAPEMDPQTALDYGPRLGLDVKRLRQKWKSTGKISPGNSIIFTRRLPWKSTLLIRNPAFHWVDFGRTKLGQARGSGIWVWTIFFQQRKHRKILHGCT